CVFSDMRTINDKFYTRLEYHKMIDNSCVITNTAFKSTVKGSLGSKCSLTEVPSWAELEPEATIMNIEKPLFAYFKYPSANNIDPDSPLGVSCFSRAVDLIKEADEQWSQLLWEFESGKRALYVDVLAFKRDEDGKPMLPHKRLYRTLNVTGDVTEGLFEEWTPEFREVSILNGLEEILRRIEFTCGLAYGTISNANTVDKTATELKISQQRSYSTITDAQKSLKDALDDLLYAMDVWATLNNLALRGKYEVSYEFDDSIIVDKDLQFQQDMRLVMAKLMSDVEFRMRNFGESKEQAEKMLAMIAPEPKQDSLFGF
ncbi:MAG TPA: hypothetical protein VIH30_07060, partial [Aquirhabdus sp.]